MAWEEIKERIGSSDMILTGIGEEWEDCPDGERVYEKLKDLLVGKNFFIVTTVVDGIIWNSKIPQDRIVAPCGNRHVFQCGKGCCTELWAQENLPEGGVCPHCGASLVSNTFQAESYVEAGYLPAWNTYMKWLQGSLNRNLLILELGVGFRTPTVIRWPFERTAYLNRKACLWRIHGTFPQLPDHLEDRGRNIKMNSVQWIKEL